MVKMLSEGATTFTMTILRAATATITGTDVSGTVLYASNMSTNFTVAPRTADRMLMLLPGEYIVPVSGKAGTPGAQTAGVEFPVTVNACDEYWNVSSTNPGCYMHVR